MQVSSHVVVIDAKKMDHRAGLVVHFFLQFIERL